MKRIQRTSAVLAAMLALVLGCSDDQDSTKEPTPSPKQKIEQTAKKWARLFAESKDRAACKLMSQPACARLDCEHRQMRLGAPDDVMPIRNCMPPSAELRESFRDAAVRDIAIEGKQAAARFTNGTAIELFWVNGYAVGGVWWIGKVGGAASHKFFPPPVGTLLCAGC